MSRRTRDRYMPRKVREVECLIDFLLARHAVGLLVLCGDEPWPSAQDVCEMATVHGSEECERVHGGESAPEGQRIVERSEWFDRAVRNAGGVDRITEVFRDLRANSVREWTILRDSAMIRRGRPYVSMGYTARTIARRH